MTVSICTECRFEKIDCKGNKSIDRTKCKFFEKENTKEALIKKVQNAYNIDHEAKKLIIDALKNNIRPKGKWVNKEGVYGAAYCSECNYELRVNNTNYCPNCGSDNRERSEK